MTRAQRVAYSRQICRRLAEKIGEFAPQGLGHWDRAWELVGPASDRFLDALGLWVEEDTPDGRQEVQRAADRLLEAWIHASARYQSASEAETVEVKRAHV
jgi:hypothetical protein